MNKEVIKAINNKQNKIEKSKKKKFSKWWHANGYKVMRVLFFYVWLPMLALEKISNKLDARNYWSKKRADEILAYYIPRRAEWDNEEQEFYFYDNGYGWSINLAKKYLKLKDRRFWNLHNGFSGGEIRRFLIEEFELEGFTKEVICEGYDTSTEIVFRMN